MTSSTQLTPEIINYHYSHHSLEIHHQPFIQRSLCAEYEYIHAASNLDTKWSLARGDMISLNRTLGQVNVSILTLLKR